MTTPDHNALRTRHADILAQLTAAEREARRRNTIVLLPAGLLQEWAQVNEQLNALEQREVAR